MKVNTNVLNLKKRVENYIYSNIKEYILILLIFVIGIFVGVFIINTYGEQEILKISNYISDFIIKFKSIEKIDKISLLIDSVKNDILLTLIMWIAGTTVIGFPIVLFAIFFRGLSLGYTIAAITYTLGKLKGLEFCIISLFVQNILFIPALLSLGVSSIKLYKSIIKDRRKENIKIEIIKHTIFSIGMLIIFIISAFFENILSIFLLQNMIKNF